MELLLSLWVCMNPKTVRNGRLSRRNITTTSTDDKQTVNRTPHACSVDLLLIVQVLMVWYPFNLTFSSERYVSLRVLERQ